MSKTSEFISAALDEIVHLVSDQVNDKMEAERLNQAIAARSRRLMELRTAIVQAIVDSERPPPTEAGTPDKPMVEVVTLSGVRYMRCRQCQAMGELDADRPLEQGAVVGVEIGRADRLGPGPADEPRRVGRQPGAVNGLLGTPEDWEYGLLVKTFGPNGHLAD